MNEDITNFNFQQSDSDDRRKATGSNAPDSIAVGFLNVKNSCKRCGKHFIKIHGNHKYCGHEFKEGTCAYLHRLEMRRKK